MPMRSGNNVEGTFCVVNEVSCLLCHGVAACIYCFGVVRPKQNQKLIFLYFFLIQIDRAYE